MEDGQLEAHLVGGKCGRVPTRSVKTVIRYPCIRFIHSFISCVFTLFSFKMDRNFIFSPLGRFFCHPSSVGPEFVYESESCDYFFHWKTPHVCLYVGQEAVDPTTPTLPSKTSTSNAPTTEIISDATTVGRPTMNPRSTAVETSSTTIPIDIATTANASAALPHNNGVIDDPDSRHARKKPVDHSVSAGLSIAAIFIVMFAIFFFSSPRFREKVRVMNEP